MTTITGLPDVTLPLSGAERVPMVQDGVAKDGTTADVAALGTTTSILSGPIFPERLDAAGTYFTTSGAGEPLSTWFAPPTTNQAGYGYVYQKTGGLFMAARGAVAATGDRIYEVEAEIEQVSVAVGESPRVRIGLISMLSSFAATDGSPEAWSPVSVALTAGQVYIARYRFAAAAPAGGAAWADPATAVWLRPVVEANRKADLTDFWPDSIAVARRLKVTDVTGIVANEARLAELEGGFETVTNVAIAAGVLTLDLAGAKTVFRVAFTSNITSIVYQNVPVSPKKKTWALEFVGDGTARTIAWHAATRPNGGTHGTINSTNGKVTSFVQTTQDGLTTIPTYKSGET